MVTAQRFWLSFITLLAFPMLFNLAGPRGQGADALYYLLLNYLWWATPHALVAVLAFWPANRGFGLLAGLTVLNVVLLGFWLWIRFAVPFNESGLVWVLYFPLSAIGLAALGIIALAFHKRRSKTSLGA